MNVNLSDNALYLETFTYKLAKHKMATKMLGKRHIFYSLSHINAQIMVSENILIDKFYLVIFYMVYCMCRLASYNFNDRCLRNTNP